MNMRILPVAGLLSLVAVVTAVALPGAATSAAAEAGGITVQGTASGLITWPSANSWSKVFR